MGGFLGWFVVIVGVLAIFNAEKLPELRALIEEKFKNSIVAAKEGSKLAKDRIKQVKTDMENKKTSADEEDETDENTPEEIAESLKFMGSYLNDKEDDKENADASNNEIPDEHIIIEEVEEPEEEKPIDLEHRD